MATAQMLPDNSPENLGVEIQGKQYRLILTPEVQLLPKFKCLSSSASCEFPEANIHALSHVSSYLAVRSVQVCRATRFSLPLKSDGFFPWCLLRCLRAACLPASLNQGSSARQELPDTLAALSNREACQEIGFSFNHSFVYLELWNL